MKTRYVLYGFLLFLLTSCGGRRDSQPQETVLRPVRVAEVQPASAGSVKTFSGVAQANQETQLSFKVAGNIESIEVGLGDRVAAGATIARLDAADFRIQYDQAVVQKKNAQVQLRNAEAQLSVARSAYDRTERLFENNSVPLSDYERARSAYETARAQVEAAQAQLRAAGNQIEAARNQLAYTRLTAPFAGVISAVVAEEKENVGAGSVVAVISAEGRPEVTFGIPGRLINSVRPGQSVEVVFPSHPDTAFAGRVAAIAFVADRSSTYPVKISLDAPSDLIRPGMAASVRLPLGEGAAAGDERLVVPAVAVGEDRAGRFVYVVAVPWEGAAFARRRPVTVGELTNHGLEIVDGLEPGERVITAGLSSLSEGMQVRMIN